VSDHVSHPYKTTEKDIVLYIFLFMYLDSKLEANMFHKWSNWDGSARGQERSLHATLRASHVRRAWQLY
jgi:hypothetical protein